MLRRPNKYALTLSPSGLPQQDWRAQPPDGLRLLRAGDLVASLASVSGTAGIVGEEARSLRTAKDDTLAAALKQGGMAPFLQAWYAQPLWTSLRLHPR